MTGSTTFRAFIIAGSGSPTTSNSVNITGSYVPSGTRTFTVSDASAYQVGNTILIYRTVTQAWIEFVGMDDLVRNGEPQTWISPGTKITTDRIITAINGNTVTVDAPITDSFDATYLGTPVGTIAKYSWPSRITQSAIEHLKIQAPSGTATYGAVTIDDAMDCWLLDVVGQNTQNAFNVSQTGKRITLEKVVNHNNVTQTATAATADFSCTGTQVFVNKCESTAKGIWPMIAGARGTGPIVVLNFKTADRGIEPHQRWTTGMLADNCVMPNTTSGKAGISYRNRSTMGSGHGWCTAWSVAWNCETPFFLVTQAPGTYNWAIGGHGSKVSSSDPQGIFDHFNSTVTPQSLYLQQLLERLGPQALSNIGYGAPVTAPAAPSNLSATPVSSSQINLSWTDNSNNESNFNIERSTNGGTTWSALATVGANTTTYSNTGIAASTTYHYRVRAMNSGGNSAFSNVANTTTHPPPIAPAYQAEEATVSQGVIESNHAGFNGTGFVNYDNVAGSYVEWKVNVAVGSTYTMGIRFANGGTADRPMSISINGTVINPGMSFNPTGLWTDWTVNTFSANLAVGVNTIRATATTASGGPNVDEFQVHGTPPPAAPSGLTATAVSSTQINLNWTDNSNNETLFRIERSLDGGSTWSFFGNASMNATTFSNTGLTPATTYHYRVYAENAGGNSAFSNVANATTLMAAPSTPNNLTATAISSSQINLSWIDNSGNEANFRIERSTDAGATWAFLANTNANVTAFSNTGLAASTTYHYRVRAENAGGNSAFSNTAMATTDPSTTLENVALNKPVTASSSDTNVPANAVDGNTTTRWSASPMPQWLEVDLGGLYDISKTEVVCYQDRAYQFVVESKTTSSGSYTQVVNRSTNTTPGTIAAPITNTFSAVAARYVRINVTGASGYTGTWASIIEFSVFGVPSSGSSADIYIEAEAGTITSPMVVQSSASASGGQLVTVIAGNNSQTAAPATGRASYTFTAPSAGTYKVWGLVMCATNSDDSFWVRMDNGTWINWNNITLGTIWVWDDVHDAANANTVMTYSLTAGSHTLEFAYREDGTQLDKVLITNNLSLDPNTAPPPSLDVTSEASSDNLSVDPYPNPATQQVTLKYVLQRSGNVEIALYNSGVHQANTVLREFQQAGEHKTSIDISALPAGLHFIRLIRDNELVTYKLIKH